MGWFTDFLFGDPARNSGNSPVLPKSVEQWERGDGTSASPAHGATQPGTQTVPPSEPTSTDAYHDTRGAKLVPEIEITRVEPHLSEDQKHVELWVTVRNESEFEIELTRIECFGLHTDPNRFLRARESHELKVYTGDTPHDHHQHKAFVDYKIVSNGDYFRMEFVIEYHYEQNEHGEFYIPKEFKRVGPVRDI